MKVTTAEGHKQPACLLMSEAFDATLLIEGIAAEELQARMFEEGRPWPWQRLAGRGVIRVSLQSDPVHASPDRTTTLERKLEDGTVRLTSGSVAELRVSEQDADPESLMPRSLYLCLAQQWARAGLLPIHGAAFSNNRKGILAIGQQSAGKSTLTAAALIVGYRVLSDDWILARPDQKSVTVERLRRFLMLRESWATDQIRQNLPNAPFRPSRNPGKIILRIPKDDQRFPESLKVHRLLILDRPEGARPAESSSSAITSTQALAALIEASMPILFSASLPVEKRTLMHAAQHLLRLMSCTSLTPGTNLITDGWSRLFPCAGSDV